MVANGEVMRHVFRRDSSAFVLVISKSMSGDAPRASVSGRRTLWKREGKSVRRAAYRPAVFTQNQLEKHTESALATGSRYFSSNTVSFKFPFIDSIK